MRPTDPFAPETLTRAELDALPGATVVEFGTNWCGWCRRAQPMLEQAFAGNPGGHEAPRLIRVEDGSGFPLGRSFEVKLWPTLVFMRDGVEVAKLVRPDNIEQVRQALAQIEAAS
ncbi:MAG TPA: thioredoxin family protein [Burkholderiales bacterium]|jgi:thioredoxin 1|nr:thioredoxin family protein [Burkholderiales bacterium]